MPWGSGSSLAAIGLFRQNPFRVAKDAAARAGGWSADQVEFRRGSFAYRGLYSVAEALLFAMTNDGVQPVEIRLIHVPFRGWSVRQFEVSAPCKGRHSHTARAAGAGDQTQRRVRARYSS